MAANKLRKNTFKFLSSDYIFLTKFRIGLPFACTYDNIKLSLISIINFDYYFLSYRFLDVCIFKKK